MLNRTPDISKIKNLINFNPKVSLDETLLSVIQYFKNNAQALEKEIE